MKQSMMALAVALVAVSGQALAEEEDGLYCVRLVDGNAETHVHHYPVMLVFDTYIYNESEQSKAVRSIWDWPKEASPTEVDIDVPGGASIGGTSIFTLESYEQCAALANKENRIPKHKPVALKTFTQIKTDEGEKAVCKARVICH